MTFQESGANGQSGAVVIVIKFEAGKENTLITFINDSCILFCSEGPGNVTIQIRHLEQDVPLVAP